MNDLQNIEPFRLWQIFRQISLIPRPSRHEDKIQEWAENFGKSLGLDTVRDEAGNIIIRKPAVKGMENRKGVILQGHLDMVPQKNSDKKHNFTTDPIELIVDGEWVTANGTTLGADNGIGAAAALAVLASDNIKHGPLEVLLTATEETGMDGAAGLKPGVLQGEIFINTDSEDEGELYVGCAGGEDVNLFFRYSAEKVPDGYAGLKLSVTGLKGGHSGIDIIRQRGNAIKIFFRILNSVYQKTGARPWSLNCGSLRNAIPREAFGVLAVDKGKVPEVKEITNRIAEIVRNELSATDPDINISVEESEPPLEVTDRLTLENLIKAVVACPNGVIRMSDTMKELVETSTNLAFIRSDTDTKTIHVGCMMRSSVDTARDELGSRMKALFELAGAEVAFASGYPGWKPDMNSPILNTMKRVYNHKFGKVPEVKAIHAGLECGILGGKYPDWDMISFGPTIRFPHSPDEKVNIASVGKFWDFLIATLENIPERS
jgi:dipeptidase D